MASSDTKNASAQTPARKRVDLLCERGILALVLAILCYAPLAVGAARLSEFVVVEALTLGVIVLWAVRLWASPVHRFLWPPVCWGVAAVAGYVLWRSHWGGVEYFARQESLKVLVYAALFLAIVNNLHRQETTRIITLVLIGLGTLISIYAVVQWITRSEHIWHFKQPAMYLGRASGTYICPNHLAGLLEMLVPLAAAYTLTGRFKPIPRIFLGYACLAMMAGMAVTISRAGWVSLSVPLLLLLVFLFRRPGLRWVSVVCLAVVLTGAFLFAKHSLRSQERLERTAIHTQGYFQNDRIRYWLAGWQMWNNGARWLGVGPAQYGEHYRLYRQESEFSQARPDHPHNDYLQLLAEWGLAGALLVASAWALLAVGMAQTWRFVRRQPSDLGEKHSNKSALILGAGLGLLALLIHSVIDFNFHIPANALVAVALMALITGHMRFASERWWFTPRGAAKVLATALLAALFWHLGAQTWRAAREQHWLAAARRLPLTSPERETALRNAAAVEPMNPDTLYALGEALRRRSFDAPNNWRPLAEEAAQWHRRGAQLNPLDPYFPAREGMCLDWLKRPEEAVVLFQRALAMDPNEYFIRALLGWHYFQTGDYAQAVVWLRKSLALNWRPNTLATTYLELAEARLKETK